MPTPDPRRRIVRRNRDEPKPTAEPKEPEEIVPRSRVARARLARTAKPAKRPPTVPILMGLGAIVVGGVLFVVLRDREPPPAKAPPVEVAPPPAPVVAAPPPPAPKPVPLPSPDELLRKLRTAPSAKFATALALDAERIGDPSLIEQCWTRVYELDAQDVTARTKLDVRALVPADDLAGFTAIKGTLQRIHLRPFEEAAKGDKTRAERAAVIEQWKLAHAAIEERIAKAKTIPYYRQVDELRQSLQQIDFFAKLDYEMVESRPPYALFVEVSGNPDERAQRRDDAEKAYTAFLDAYDKKIRSYLVPLAPKPPAEEPFFPVFVFLNFERYRDYSVADHGAPPSPAQRAHYEPLKKQSFTYSPVLKIGLGAFQTGTQALLHELTHAWVDQLASPDGGETRSIATLSSHWFSEGIAEYMSCEFLHQDEVRFQPWRSSRVAGAYRPPGWRIPLRTALNIPMHGLDGMAALMVKDLAPDKREAAIGTISSGFYADMSNFILWLNLRSGANRPAQFEAYAREELSGRGGFDAFQRCVPKLLDEVADLDGTIDDFVKRIANGNINPYKEFEEAQPKPGQ